jgi:3-(3-hydroxy-phenyl)propionate hydroxylase
MTDHDVVIAGGGPTGMVLGAELLLGGVDAVIVERRAGPELDGSRAGGLHARTLEVLDQRGVADRYVAEGQPMATVGFAGATLPLDDLPSRHRHGLALWQRDVERITAGWLAELGVPFVRQVEVTGFAQDDDGVDVHLSDGRTLRTRYLVGCDGGRSTVRKAAGIAFPGLDATRSWMIAEAAFAEEPVVGMRPEGGGIGPIARDEPDDDDGGDGDGGGDDRAPYRIVLTEPVTTGQPTIADLRAALTAAYGTDFGVHGVTWISRFTDVTRQAATYRSDRVLLAGDAAHVHPPQGGQGLNLGVQDAVNLGWKLALVVAGHAPEALLDTYHDERHPVGARVLQLSKAFNAALVTDERHEALREVLAEELALDEPRRRLAARLTGLDVRYDLGAGHPLLGRRVPDVDLETTAGPTRLAVLLHQARPVLLTLADGADVLARVAAPWGDRVRLVAARSEGPWELPVVGPVSTPAAVLVRPDGHAAWVADPDVAASDDGGGGTLADALTQWCGPAAGATAPGAG